MSTAGRRRASALPLRVRLVAGFAVAMTAVLSAAGAFVAWRVAYALDLRVDRDLRGQAAALGPLVGQDGRVRDDAALARTPSGRRYQVLDARGRVLTHGPELDDRSLLSDAQVERALHGVVITDTADLLPVRPHPLRLLAEPLDLPGPARVLLVADRLDDRDEALRELLGQLAAAGISTLVVTTVVGDRLARAALSPVERYRTQAASIAAGASGVRLDVPDARDDEVTRLGHTLNAGLDALERAVERERRFAQDASHELRTPLTVLSTRVQLALRRQRTAAEHEAVLTEVGRDVDALVQLAEQLLEVSTATQQPAGGADLAAAAAQVVGELATGDRLVLRLPGHDVLTALSAPAARQVLRNLVGNALLHGGSARVDVALDVPDGVARLSVVDDGPGVPPAFLPLAADRFARADDARARPGAGLGLSLVRAAVERAGGELRLCSADTHHRYAQRVALPCSHPAAGTTATVLLPLGQALDVPVRPSYTS